MHEHSGSNWSPRLRRVRPVYERHLAGHAARRAAFLSKDEFTVRSVREGGRETLAAHGELDLSSAWELERELRRAEATDASEIVVDLGGLRFIDSAGMEVVIHASSRTCHHGKRLMIRRGPDAVHRTFERAGIAALLPFVAAPGGTPLP